MNSASQGAVTTCRQLVFKGWDEVSNSQSYRRNIEMSKAEKEETEAKLREVGEKEDVSANFDRRLFRTSP